MFLLSFQYILSFVYNSHFINYKETKFKEKKQGIERIKDRLTNKNPSLKAFYL